MNFKKHRIVGALVLIALGIVFLPLLFQGRKGPDIRIEDIPARPAQSDITRPVNLPAPIMLAPSTQRDVAAAWSLQLGSFADVKRATKLVEQLRAKGYAAYMRSAKVGDTMINRVYVGPELDQATLKEQAAQIQKKLRLKGSIVTYRAILGAEHG